MAKKKPEPHMTQGINANNPIAAVCPRCGHNIYVPGRSLTVAAFEAAFAEHEKICQGVKQ